MPKKSDPYLLDEDNPEATADDFRRMRPASEVLPRKLYDSLVAKYEARHAGGDDKDGRIQQKRSDTLNKNLSRPIPGFSPDTTLGEMRKNTSPDRENGVRRAAEKTGK